MKPTPERFRALGARPESVHVTGSMKYDGAPTDRRNAATQRLAALAGFLPDDAPVLLAGSTQEPEEAMALRHVSPRSEEVAGVAADAGPSASRSFRGGGETVGNIRRGVAAAHRDAVAKPAGDGPGVAGRCRRRIGAWWGTAQIAFVGGSMGSRGGQNMIEPAAYGAAVSFGPNTLELSPTSWRRC
jgi:3-deoxy-D-manno-octulosonic-acid transferase